MNAFPETAVKKFIAAEDLPEDYLATARLWFQPLAEKLLDDIAAQEGTFVLGISGSQGSGKSTLAALLVLLFREMAGLRCVNLSLDDFYLGHEERRKLATEVHPLLQTRGVPGTHDVPLALATLEALTRPGQVAIPRFDKARDDRYPPGQWPTVQAPLDVVIFEGWCLGVEAQEASALDQPVNALEAEEDADGRWRRYVNKVLGEEYPPLFRRIDHLLMLRAPAFEAVYRWRQQQEDKLRAQSAGTGQSKIMDPEALRRFIQHYERLTRHALDSLPRNANTVFELSGEQAIIRQSKG